MLSVTHEQMPIRMKKYMLGFWNGEFGIIVESVSRFDFATLETK